LPEGQVFARMRGALCLFFVLLSLGENTQGRSLFRRGRSLGRAGHFGQGRDKEQGLGKVVCERADFQRGRLDVEEARACRRCCCLTTQNVDVSWHWCECVACCAETSMWTGRMPLCRRYAISLDRPRFQKLGMVHLMEAGATMVVTDVKRC